MDLEKPFSFRPGYEKLDWARTLVNRRGKGAHDIQRENHWSLDLETSSINRVKAIRDTVSRAWNGSSKV